MDQSAVRTASAYTADTSGTGKIIHHVGLSGGRSMNHHIQLSAGAKPPHRRLHISCCSLAFALLSACLPATAADQFVRLRSASGSFVSFASNPASLVATAGAKERILLIDEDGGALKHNDSVLLLTDNANYFTADFAAPARTFRTVISVANGWEKFTIERADGADREIIAGDAVAFRAYPNQGSKPPAELRNATGESAYFSAAGGVFSLGGAVRGAGETFILDSPEPVQRPAFSRLSAPFSAVNKFQAGGLIDLDVHKGTSGSDCRYWNQQEDRSRQAGPRHSCYDGHDGIDLPAGGSQSASRTAAQLLRRARWDRLFDHRSIQVSADESWRSGYHRDSTGKGSASGAEFRGQMPRRGQCPALPERRQQQDSVPW